MTCDNCPCPAGCPGWDVFCGWMAERPVDPVKRRHICDRAAVQARPPEEPPRPDVIEAVALVAAMNACPHRTIDPGCGCAGAKCGLRGGHVAHPDCFACLKSHAVNGRPQAPPRS